MRACEFITEDDESIYEAKMVWGMGKHDNRGGQDKLKFRCTSGPRKSRQVSHPSKCHDHPNVAAAQRMKTTRARTEKQQARRAKRTKSINTASVLANKLNNPGNAKTPKPYY
jgi:hypothetical protein